jgi:hypothetical protein
MFMRRGVLAALTVLLGVASANAQKVSEMQRALEEFKAQTRNLGLRADSPASARRKSANRPKFHGRLFENFRNDILDATPHEIRQRGSSKSLLRRNQFGFNLAGPLIIPKLYDHGRSTFFSVSYEGVRERISRSFLRTVPTIPERFGDFSSTVDLAGQPLPMYDPASTRPNSAFDASQPVTPDNLQYLRNPFPGNVIPASRIDSVAAKALEYYPQPNASVGPYFRNNYFVVSPETNTANGMIVKVDHNIADKHRLAVATASSNGLIGAANIFPTIADPNLPDRTFASRSGSLDYSYTASPRTIISLDIAATSDRSQNHGDQFPAYRFGNGYAPLGRANPDSRNVRNSFVVTNALSTRTGNHALKLSARLTHQQQNTLTSAYPLGSYHFGSGLTSLPGIVNTGDAFASYLMGYADTAEASVVLSPSYLRKDAYNLAGRDSWEIRRGLTLTTSLMLDITTPRTEKYDRQANVDFRVGNPMNGLPGALVFANRNGYGRAFGRTQVRPEPSAAIAWTPAGHSKTVIRASYSRSYEGIHLNGPSNTQGFNFYPTFVSANAQLAPAATLQEGLPLGRYQQPDLRPDGVNGMVADLLDVSTRMPCYQSTGVSAEREVGGVFLLTTGYYHQDGKNLYVGNSAVNVNAIPLEDLAYRDQLNDEAFRASLRPFPQYVGFDVNSGYPLGRYQRDAGYLRVEKRTSGGLGMSAYYEFSKQMDDYSGPYGTQDFYHRENEWSMTAGSTPQRVTLSYVYELPLGPSKSLMAYSDWRRFLVEGWMISGMTTMNSGEPLALHPQFNNTGGVVQSLNVNVVPGVDPTVPEQGPQLWFNPAAFVQPPDFTVGNASRTHPSLRGPLSQNHDLSVSKRFSLDADRTVELSAVGFNFLNHANWNDPDTMIGTASAPNANAGRIIGSLGGRVLQLGLRYSF